nr:hypothetical protein [Collimonas sp. PA-H2]
MYEKYDMEAAYLVTGVAGVSGVSCGTGLTGAGVVFGATLGCAGAVLTIGGGSAAGMNSGPFWPHAVRVSGMAISAIMVVRDKSKMGFTD